MPRIYIAVAIVVVLLLSGCTKPPYWVKGLTLPPGSTVSEVSETTSLGGMAATMPGLGTPKRVLNVSFENAGGWAVVSAHVDRQMAAEGYHEAMSGLANMSAGMPGGASSAAGMMSGMRMYSKPGSVYNVMLMDVAGMMSGSGGGAAPPGGMQGIPGLSGFTLMVMELE